MASPIFGRALRIFQGLTFGPKHRTFLSLANDETLDVTVLSIQNSLKKKGKHK